MVPPGIEPGTQGFSVLCSTDWAMAPTFFRFANAKIEVFLQLQNNHDKKLVAKLNLLGSMWNSVGNQNWDCFMNFGWRTHFRFSLLSFLPHYTLSFIHSQLFSRPHLIIGAPDLRRERAVRQKTSCLSRRKAASYLSFSEQAAIGSMRRCSLDLFCILFCIKVKKYVGFGATPQESIDNG